MHMWPREERRELDTTSVKNLSSTVVIYYAVMSVGVTSRLLATIVVACLSVHDTRGEDLVQGQFPSSFIFGVTSSAFPTEGAWNDDGKGPSIWDTFTADQNNFQGDGNAHVAADAYHKVNDDVQLIKNLGVSHYRFSISWPRILSDGTNSSINTRGLQYYSALIDELIAVNIIPVVTLHYWDLPQALQDKGGWTNDAIVTWFTNYADVCFQNFGSRVKLWITHNDPFTLAYRGHELGDHAPGLKRPDQIYKVGHNLIKSHVETCHLYHSKYRSSQGGQIGISLSADWYTPETAADTSAAETARQFRLGWFASPLLNGDYPQVMKEKVALKSTQQGLQSSRLPRFNTAEKHRNKGSLDFLGINHYKTKLVSDRPAGQTTPNPGFYNDQDLELKRDLSYPKLEYRPEYEPNSDRRLMGFGLKDLLLWIKTQYNNPTVYITENGLDSCGTMRDQNRVQYIREYSNNVLRAIQQGCDVRGYFVSSLLDGFNWADGYTTRTGLYYVAVFYRKKPRYPRFSATFYKKLVKNRGLNTELTNYRVYDVDRDVFHWGTFPDGFMWGTSSSAYQVEGGWDADGKGPSIWDTWAHAGKIPSKITGDVSCDSYHRYMEDVANLKELGVHFYRFSISWSRVLPDGTPASLNPAGIAYYNNLLNALAKENITAMVTLYHWDLPQALQDHDGWRNDSIIQKFEDYARICFENFGDRVQYWLTFNEPFVIAWQGYGRGQHPPGLRDAGWGVYSVAHNIIRSHSRVYHLYSNRYKSRYRGKISITLDIEWKEGFTDSPEDAAAAERAIQFKLGWFANAIFVNGDYPDVMKKMVAEKSRNQGYDVSRLPEFTEDEKKMNKGSFDFLGIHHYTSSLMADKPHPQSKANFELDQDVEHHFDLCWWPDNDWNRFNPWGIRYLLGWVKEHYNNPPVFILENGIGTWKVLEDDTRITYHKYYINELMKAVNKDAVDVRGYAVWSLMDSCEWGVGFLRSFGLYQVNFNHPNRTRTPRKSADWYSNLIKDNGFPMSID